MRKPQQPLEASPGTRPWQLLLVMLATVFVLKLVVLLQLRNHPLTSPDAGLDTTAYVELANKVLGGDWALGPALYHVSPFYIYFLSALLAFGHSFTFVRLVQIGLGTASVGFVFLAARIWFGDRAAWIAAILAGLTGLFTFFEVLILQSSVDAFFTSAALYALAVGSRGAGIAGVIWGIQSLNRPNVLIAAAGVALVMLVATRRVKPAAMLVAGVLIGLAPVIVRNVVVSHEFALVSSHGGLNFYIGNNEHATGYYVNVPGVTPTIVGQERDTRRIAARALGRPVDDVTDGEASSYFTGLARQWIADHPGAAAALFVKKFALSFHAAHVPLPHSYSFFAYDTPTALRFYAVGPWLLTPLGIVGLLVGWRRVRSREYLVWLSFVPAYAASVAVFFVADRYRMPLLVPLCVGAGAALDGAARAVRARSGSALAAAGFLIVLFGAANMPLAIDDGRWTEGLRLAQRLVLIHRDADARQWAEWLETHGGKRPGAGYYGVGSQYLTIGDASGALPYLQKAFALDPSDRRVEYALGMALFKTGQTAAALDRLRGGFEAGVEIPDGGIDYPLALDAAGDAAAAGAAATRVHPVDPDDAEGWLRLGRIAMQAKAPRVAEPFFHRAVQLRPDLAAARQQYGLCLLVGRRVEDAARELAEAVRLDPRNADSLAHLAYAEATLGRSAEAVAHARAALAVEPDNMVARQLLYTLGGGSR